MNDKKQKIVIAGATGFVGRHLIQHLLKTSDYDIVALSRFETKSDWARVSFKTCNLFSMLEIEEALEGAAAAYYLIHPVMPSANLDQGAFYDYDLLLADNFARAANKAKLKQVIYLGRLISHERVLSDFLQSRLEVEAVFQENQFAFTGLRAGTILGADGTAIQVMWHLLKRQPILLIPQWARIEIHPIAVEDVVTILGQVLLNEAHYKKVYDVGVGNCSTYAALLVMLANKFSMKRLFIPINLNIFLFSKFWIRFVSGVRKEVVYPFIESLRSPMFTNAKYEYPVNFVAKTIEESFGSMELTKRTFSKGYVPQENRYVRSVQRLVLPKGMNAQDVALEYMNWLPRFMFPIFFVETKNEQITFSILHPKIHLLYLKYSKERSTPDRALFYVTGGLLAKPSPKARLEFRETLDKKYIITGIHDFVPTLPWPIYRCTQALVHLWVTYSFGKHLARLKERRV